MRPNYDLVVVGGGSAGLTAAGFARRLGASVLVIERDRLGGDCTWTGCIPSKALLHAAVLAHAARLGAAIGIHSPPPVVDLNRVMGAARAASERVYGFESPEILAEQGIDVAIAEAVFADPKTVLVGGAAVSARRFILCPGARPVVPSIPGLAATPHLTNLGLFEVTELPRRLVVLGGGSIGVETAQAFRRLGSEVVIVEAGPRLLPAADPEASAVLTVALESEGIEVRCGTAVTAARPGPAGGVLLTVAESDVTGDLLLVAAGRSASLESLRLDRAGVAFTAAGIEVDDRLRTTAEGIYAAGDAVAGSPQYTHYAGWQGFTAARNALLPSSANGRRATVPWVVFTDPEVAQVGASEAELTAAGTAHVVRRWPAERNDRAQTRGEEAGFLKFLLEPGGRLLGATLVGSSAGELVNELSLALTQGLKLADLASAMHAYPTYGFAIYQAAAQAAVEAFGESTLGRVAKRLV
ncbi:MAG: FAD-dependent oxidoreductase [Candidatus Dormibacteraceae bacterium]